ncbi:right-handed parallel beta-helix repeat-containing protein, partial [bacterium]|nr:right-handed parallel beta-helix repeat-containing protein [bacterium]MBU1653148.1 right-handed parallel beta-helix repeat-containing protein [bacterium]
MRTRTICYFLTALLLSSIAMGQTYVSGEIGNATWTAAGSPYIVINDVHASSLTVEAGVEVLFDSLARIEIVHEFNVSGTESDSVYFHAGSSSWKTIDFGNDANTGSHLIEYAWFEGAGNFSSTGVLRCDGHGSLTVRHCTFTNNNGTILRYDVVTNYIFQLEESEFYNNSYIAGTLINCIDYQHSIIRNCEFHDNNYENLIYLHPDSDISVMQQCLFYNNESEGAIWFGNGTITNSVFYNTTSVGFPLFGAGSYLHPFNVENSIIWEEDSIATDTELITIQYCDLPVIQPGEGNISIDPLFVNPSGGDFTVQASSPCINAGNPRGFWTDQDGTRADMGLSGDCIFIPFPTKIQMPRLYPGESVTLPFSFANLTESLVFVDSCYTNEPDYFTALLHPYSGILSPYEVAICSLTFTHPGFAVDGDLFVSSTAFIAGDTASVPIITQSEEYLPVSGVWTAESSPYTFDQNLIVEDGQQLIIEPGVIVNFDEEVVFRIEGNLQALGTEGDTIRLRNSYGSWDGLNFIDADGENVLNYVKLQSTQGSPVTDYKGGSIYASNSALSIKNCYVPGTNYGYSNVAALEGGAIYLEDCPEVTIRDCFIGYVYNVSSNYETTAGGGIYALNCPQLIIERTDFQHCAARDIGGALYLDNSRVLVDSCEIIHPKILYQGNTGIAFYLDASELYITRTVIRQYESTTGEPCGIFALAGGSAAVLDHNSICFKEHINHDIGGFHLIDDASTVIMNNSVLYQADYITDPPSSPNMQIDYSMIPYLFGGTGNLTGDPLMTQECYLTSGSRCIDAGNPASPFDPDSTIADMGAHYWDGNGPYGGPISGVWSLENSPYIIGDDVSVQLGDTLIIEAGVTVEFLDYNQLDVYGVLLIEGTPLDSVYITAPNPQYSEIVRFYFYNAAVPSTIIYGAICTSSKSFGLFCCLV